MISTPPVNLLRDYKEVFNEEVFSRYILKYREQVQDLNELSTELINQEESALCILNTKKASYDLYKKTSAERDNVFLLNTLQTLKDRREKLEEVKHLLENKERVFLVSTQLIEAGIDVSFPTVYRDLAPFPSIVQASGRCNRNGELNRGRVTVCRLIDEYSHPYYSYIYRDLMDFTISLLKDITEIKEENLLSFQQEFFQYVSRNLEVGRYKLRDTNNIDDMYYLSLAVQKF